MFIAFGLTLSFISSRGSSEVPAPASIEDPELAAHSAEPSLETIRVPLKGVPPGAQVTFDEVPVPDNVLVGRPGRAGRLEVRALGFETHREAVTLSKGSFIDLRSKLRLAKASLPPTLPVVPSVETETDIVPAQPAVEEPSSSEEGDPPSRRKRRRSPRRHRKAPTEGRLIPREPGGYYRF